ncbi:VOC family protein [Halegenticoccus tardaugens]|uniref:VOC family protein n=1 Tax=Halegenticoccus tardaugens TaxID=2071624 RepID=UPI00100C2189|nr:VOC family protein [Halegenticoccus tardaugens]
MIGPHGTLPGTTRTGEVSLHVNDLDLTTAFYRDVIGLAVRRREGDRTVLGAGDESLLELCADSDAPERKRNETGLFHTAFLVPSRAALGDALERIEARWRLDGASDHRVSEALYLADPEDNGVEVYRDRPRDVWPSADDGAVRMDTLPLDLDQIRDLGRGEPTAPNSTTVGHVHLEVSSLSASRAFYVDALGMHVRQLYGDAALFVAAGDYHHHVGLNVWNGRTAPPTGRGLRRFELVVPDHDALEAAQARLDGRGISDAVADEGMDVSDPDGIGLRLRVAGE